MIKKHKTTNAWTKQYDTEQNKTSTLTDRKQQSIKIIRQLSATGGNNNGKVTDNRTEGH